MMLDANPYLTPVSTSPRTHRMPLWLKRTLWTVAALLMLMAVLDAAYMLRQTKMSGRWTNATFREMYTQWLREEWHGSVLPKE